MQDQITEKNCPYCPWSGPSNSFSAHLAECPNIDHSTGSVRETPPVATDGGRRLESGARVIDRDEDGDYPTHAVVLDVTHTPADRYPIVELDGRTVADENPRYREDADVVLLVFAPDLDEHVPGWEDYSARQLRKHTEQTTIQVYAYPAPRLRVVDPDEPAPNPGGGVHV